MSSAVNGSENQSKIVDTQTGQPVFERFSKDGKHKDDYDMDPSAINHSDSTKDGKHNDSTNDNDKSKTGQDNSLSIKPAKDGGVNIKVNGQTVHLTPGTALTIDSEGHAQISTSKVKPEVKPSAFPMAHGPYETGYETYTHGVTNGLPGLNPEDATRIGSVMNTGDSFRNAYQGAGVDSTANAIGKSQTDYMQNQINKQAGNDKQLNVDKGMEL